jgi:hypothetical protein
MVCSLKAVYGGGRKACIIAAPQIVILPMAVASPYAVVDNVFGIFTNIHLVS